MRVTQNQRVAGTLIAVVVAAILLFAAARSGAESGGHAHGTPRGPVELGRDVFADNCAGRHYADSLEAQKAAVSRPSFGARSRPSAAGSPSRKSSPAKFGTRAGTCPPLPACAKTRWARRLGI
ncbi:MAG: hypothetical protein ACLFRG_15580 [Desulfococcaceae bacterium]